MNDDSTHTLKERGSIAATTQPQQGTPSGRDWLSEKALQASKFFGDLGDKALVESQRLEAEGTAKSTRRASLYDTNKYTAVQQGMLNVTEHVYNLADSMASAPIVPEEASSQELANIIKQRQSDALPTPQPVINQPIKQQQRIAALATPSTQR